MLDKDFVTDVLTSYNLLEHARSWNMINANSRKISMIKLKVDVVGADIRGVVSFKIDLIEGAQDINNWSSKLDYLSKSLETLGYEGTGIKATHLEDMYKSTLEDVFYIPVFEVPEMKSIRDKNWHAPIFKTIGMFIDEVHVDWNVPMVESFNVNYEFSIEEVSKGYDNW